MPAPKKALVRAARPAADAASSATPASASATAAGNSQPTSRELPRSVLASWEGSTCPASRLRFRDAREGSQRPPDADRRRRHAADGPGGERYRRYVQRERVGADRIHPPRSQAHHHQRGVPDGQQHARGAAGDGQQQAFCQEEPAHVRRAEPDRTKQAHLTATLLHAELEEERRQDQCRHDEEKS